MFSNAFMEGQDDDLPFRVELWDDKDSHIEEVIALASDYATARSAYEEAIKRRPGRIVTLRQKTRVLADSRRQT
jgi:hypothetical protein